MDRNNGKLSAERWNGCRSGGASPLSGRPKRNRAGSCHLTIVKNKAYSALLAGSILWCAAIIAAPFINLSPVYAFFSIICHQDPARSWQISGAPLPVCIRCASIYFSFLASLCCGLPRSVRWLRMSIVFMLAEFAVARLFIDSAFLRSISGILVGAATAPFVRQGVEEMFFRRKVLGETGETRGSM